MANRGWDKMQWRYFWIGIVAIILFSEWAGGKEGVIFAVTISVFYTLMLVLFINVMSGGNEDDDDDLNEGGPQR